MLKVLELFAGIGAFSKALNNLGIEHEIVDAVEIDKFAIKSFNAIHGTDFESQDITKWNKDIKCDVIMHGSPCQDLSIAGKQAGGDENSGTRSSLMYETLRIVEKLRPKYVIWENVKNLLSKRHRHNFDAYFEAMEGLGYTNFYQVLNAKDYGVPQNRERVFTVSIRLDVPYATMFEFPEPITLKKKLKDVLEDNVDERYYLNNSQVEALIKSNYEQNKRFYDPAGLSPTLNTMGGDHREPKIIVVKTANTNGYDLATYGDGIDLGYPESKTRRGRVGHGICKTIPTSNLQGCIDKTYRIRKLTPKECWRLMGFSDQDYENATKVCSNTQLYKQAGNSIVVNVLEEIIKNLI